MEAFKTFHQFLEFTFLLSKFEIFSLNLRQSNIKLTLHPLVISSAKFPLPHFEFFLFIIKVLNDILLML